METECLDAGKNQFQTIRNWYHKHPKLKKELERDLLPGHGRKFDEVLRQIEQNPPRDFSAGGFDRYLHTYPHGDNLVRILAGAPAETVHKEFGEDALWFIIVGHPGPENGENFLYRHKSLFGNDAISISKAMKTVRQHSYRRNIRLTKTTYHLIQAGLNDIVGQIELPRILQRHAREGVELSQQRLQDYDVYPITPQVNLARGYPDDSRVIRTGKKSQKCEVFLDGPIGFVLSYKDESNAVVGFVLSDVNTLLITQLQGIRPVKPVDDGEPEVRGSARGLMPLDWQNILVGFAEITAKHLGFSRLAIQSGHNNAWTKPDDGGKIYFPLERALQVYDGTAEKLGFEQREDSNWYKILE